MPSNRWTPEALRVAASMFSTRKEFERGNGKAYAAARSKGLLDEICAHMAPLLRTWTFEALLQEASKYSTRSEFQKANSSAYTVAWRYGHLDRICRHMTIKKFHWSKFDLTLAALMHSSRGEFSVHNPAAYGYAHKKGWLDEICSHMQRVQSDYDAFYILADTVYQEGLCLVKFGVTSRRLGVTRPIAHLAHHFAAGRIVSLLNFRDALSIERHFLNKYDLVPNVLKSDGSSELRLLPVDEVKVSARDAAKMLAQINRREAA
jgi:hypothetical protein